MRVPSSRAATAAAVLAGLGMLVVVGRLLPTAPTTRHPTTTTTTGATSAPAIRTAPGNTRGYAVPDVLGRTLAQAERVMRAAGLQGRASDRDPQGPTAVVAAQEPPAGVLVPPGSVIGFRTRTDVQPNDTPRRLRLPGGPTTAAYRVVAPDPAQHQLTVVVGVPRATDVAVWLESGASQRLPVLDSPRDTTTCQPTRGQVRCVVRFGALEAEEPGVWTVSVAKQSALPAAIHGHGQVHAAVTRRHTRRTLAVVSLRRRRPPDDLDPVCRNCWPTAPSRAVQAASSRTTTLQ